MIHLSLTATAVVLLATPASAAVVNSVASFENGTFSEFASINVAQGTLANTSARAFSGNRSVRATYSGSGRNGYARGLWNVLWPAGTDVWYGMAIYLEPGFKANMRGGIALMRWDNYGLYGSGGDIGGLVIFGSDRKAYVVRGRYGEDYDQELGLPFDIPEGEWVWLEVHQRFTSAPLTETYVNGSLKATSTADNYYGRPISRIRYGIVSTSAAGQTEPLALHFDRASVSTTARGPHEPVATSPAAQPSAPSEATGTPSPRAGADRTRRTVGLARRVVRLKRGFARVRVSCPDSVVTGTVRATTTRRPRGGRRLRLGARAFECQTRGTRTVNIRLSRRDERVLRRLGRTRVRVTVLSRDEGGNTVTSRATLALAS